MRGLWSRRCAAAAVAWVGMLVCAAGASAQASTPGLGDQLFSTGGQITVEVLSASTSADSHLRLYDADGTFTPIATNRQLAHSGTLPARPAGGELVFGIFVPPHRSHPAGMTFKMGPGDRNPDRLAHAKVTKIAEGRFEVGFEDTFDGGDRDYNDSVFRFTGGLLANRAPVADDQALTVAQRGLLPITLSGGDPDADRLTFSLTDGPRHGALTGSGAALTYTPRPAFSGTDTFGFAVDDGESAGGEGRITIKVTPTGVAPPPTTNGSSIFIGKCSRGEITLLNVRRVGRRVLLTGRAERTLARAPVNILEGGTVIARTPIRLDGMFRLQVRVPSSRGGRVLRYQARLGLLRSRNVRLSRRMITTSARLRSGRIVFKGRVLPAPRRDARPLVRLLARSRACGTGRRIQIGRARLHRDGSFQVSGRPLKGVDIAVYQAHARLRGRNASFTLPQTIERR
jgi:hypothetical protein